MGTVPVERTTVRLTAVLNSNGGVVGEAVDCSVYDSARGDANKWLNMTTGVWQDTEDVALMTAGPKDGWYEVDIDLANVPLTARRLIAFYKPQGIVIGDVAYDELLLDTSLESTLLAVAAEVAAIKVSTDDGGPGPWQTGAGGAPGVYAAAVWGALKASFNDPDTFGELMNQIDLGNLDTNSIIEAINTATSLVLNNLGAVGACPVPEMILGNMYTGHKGDQLISPVFRNGALMMGPEFEGATQLTVEINNITDGTQLDITDGVNKGPEGYFVYTTRLGDGAFETRGKWEYQFSGLDGLGAPFVSQKLTVRVQDDVA